MTIWKVKDAEKGVFTVANPHKISEIYFPLTNTQGSLFSCITPYLTGDIKTSINNFLNLPQSACDLHSHFSTRTLWLSYEGKIVNVSSLFNEISSSELEAGPLYHILRIELRDLSIEILNFVPEASPAEIMRFTVTNKTAKQLDLSPVFAMPLFARSADNLRDHRHVTSLLSRITTDKNCITVKPTMAFDERGHMPNATSYFAAGYVNEGRSPKRLICNYEEFVGEGGSLLKPGYIYEGDYPTLTKAEGKEPFAGIDFGQVSLLPGENTSFTIVMGITEKLPQDIVRLYDRPAKVEAALNVSRAAWLPVFTSYKLDGGDQEFGFWAQWVNMQPTFRKLFGCSFLPHFDYGRGGRGWRDLWQALLGLLLFDPSKTRQTLINNFKGVRIDGSNATIIKNDGGFLADRNRISRVWMDHGLWPYITLRLYLDQTGDLEILFHEIPYFKDNLLNRAKANDPHFPEKDNLLRSSNGKPYAASIFEHTLIQNLIQFYNVGDHGCTKLEDADWNDGLDMAHGKGESVAFTCMYAANLADMAALLREIKDRRNTKDIEITAEIKILLDTLSKPVNYSSVKAKRVLLEKYYKAACKGVSGRKLKIPIDALANDLDKKAGQLTANIRKNEWLRELGVYNGYYDNAGKKVEQKNRNGQRLTLTSGVFSIMSGIATDAQVNTIHKSFGRTLLNKEFGTYRLNTNFNEVKLDLGRAFAFSYGDKENGAVFAHMDVMFAFALYKRGFIREGYEVMNGLFKMATGRNARIYPCLSEYFNASNRGLYNYLTGSASWYTYLLITQSFGVRHNLGALIIEPKLVKEQFGVSGYVRLTLSVDGKPCEIIYRNPQKKDFGRYVITAAKLNGEGLPVVNPEYLTIGKERKARLLNAKKNVLEITLG